jgi:hypothetical protein
VPVGRNRPIPDSDGRSAPKRWAADAREVAAVVALLASPEAGYVTGASWVIDGGMLLMGPQAGHHLDSDRWREV